MIRALLCENEQAPVEEGGAELIERWRRSSTAQIWVVLLDEPADDERKLLIDAFGLHPLAVADAQRDRHPPKVEVFPNKTFLLLKGLDAESASLDLKTIQLAVFFGDRFLVTRSSARSLSTEKVFEELKTGALPATISRGALALRLCRVLADRFLPILLDTESRLARMEAEMLERPSDKLLAELVRQKADLKQLLRILQYHAQLFAQARSSDAPGLVGLDHELVDVHEQQERQLSLARLYYELTDDLMNGYLSLSAHRLNQIMQTLTIVTVVFVPLGFMAGVYGMNFEYIPELGLKYGYFGLLGVMASVAVSVLVFFWWRGWLGRR